MPDAVFVKGWPHVVDFSFNLKEGDNVNRITSSLNRYGHLTLIAGNRESIEDAFDKYETAPGQFVNGQQTLGENIGDNGGLNIAYRALQNVMKEKSLGTIDGFTPEQRFFLAWGRVWASNMRPEYVELLLKVDVHSPNMARVNGALPHINAWYDAFGVKKGDKLFIPKKQRAQIW